MIDLNFKVTGAEPVANGLAPLIQFRLEIDVTPPSETVQALILHSQIQIQSPQRPYTPGEKEKLVEIFGPPERWSQNLRNRPWTQVHTTTPAFTGSTTAILPVPCTYDLNILATKYFSALEDGYIPLLFLFSGSIFYGTALGQLQVQRISWDKECTYRMPLSLWQEVMAHHFGDTRWLSLHRDIFERLCAFKRANTLPTWDETMERLLPAALEHPDALEEVAK